MDSQNRGQSYQRRGGGGRGGGGGGGQQRGRGRGSWANQGGPPPERGPPRTGGGPGPQGDYSQPQRFSGGPRSVSPGQGPPGSQQFARPGGPPPFSAPRSAPAPWANPYQHPPTSEPSRPAWGRQDAPAAEHTPPSTQEPAKDPGLPQPAQEGKPQGKRGKRGGGGKQGEASKAPEPSPGPAPIQESTDPALPIPQQTKSAGKGKGKGGKKGGSGDGDKPQGSGTPATPGPSQSSPTQGITKQMETFTISKSSLMIPRRPEGQKIQHRPQFFGPKFTVEVNYLPIKFKDINMKIYHYDVTFNPDRPKSLYRQALSLLLGKYAPNRHPAFDGKKNVYAAGTKLPFKGDVIRDSISVHDPERGKEANFDIVVKLVDQDLSLSKLAEYLKKGTSVDIPQDVIQGVDIALRNAPVMNPNFVPVGRSFFAIPRGEPVVYLGAGFELWHGHYQSAIMSWKPYLNVDVANKAFPAPQAVLDFIENDLNVDLRRPMENAPRYKLLRFLKGLKIDYKMRSNDPSGFTKRTYKVNDLGDPPNRHRFKPDKEGSREITVEQYFVNIKKIPLRFPHLPTIVTSNGNYLPIEFCDITPNQAIMRKLDEKQTAVMVKSAAKGTDIRKTRIMSTIGQCHFNQDMCAKEFGIELDMNFERVDAQILKPPSIRYSDNRTVLPRNGVWQTRNGERFINSPGLHSWMIINTDRRVGQQQINNLIKNLRDTGRNIGIDVQDPMNTVTINVRSEADFENEFKRYKDVQIFVVIMTSFGVEDIYSKIKRAAELKVGVLTQCLKANTCDFRKMNSMTAHNILLKINSKISGVNHSLAQNIMPEILKRPVMIVGADVTHPAPGTDGLSIAAVAASHDSYAFKYNMTYRLQAGRQEMIVNLQDMIEQQLLFFYKQTNRKPDRILYYRDGVSEGQFLQVLNVELQAIRAACNKIAPGGDYKPAVTFLVVQKRHHTRFFPGPNDWDGPKNKNVMAGTLVDTSITHPTEVDFYLVSHQSIQGTARPTKYHLLWDDSNIPQDELEQLTYYLCHMFARCNRSVSYPAPTYYAHLAAFRARAWWDGQRYDSVRLAEEQNTRGKIQDHIVNNAPMFFV